MFEALYRQHATRLYNLTSRMTAAKGEADDLLQDIFLQAYRKMGSFRGESSLGTWLYRLAMNHCLDVLRNPACRAAFLLHDVEGFGHQEAGTMLGVSVVRRRQRHPPVRSHSGSIVITKK